MTSLIDSLGSRRIRIYALALVPLLALGLIMGHYAATSRIADLEQALYERGRFIARYLAFESGAPLAIGDIERLSALIGIAAMDADVVRIIIHGENGEVVAHTADFGLHASQLLVHIDEPVYARPAVADMPAIGRVDVGLSRNSTLLRSHAIVRDAALLAAAVVLLMSLYILWLGRYLVPRPARDDGVSAGAVDRRRDPAGEGRAETVSGDEQVDFLANMSHELRTPINAVIGYTALMEKAGLSPEQHEYARIINCASTQLLRVIDDILAFSRLESGVVQLDAGDFDLREVLEDALCMMAPEARDKRLELVLIMDPRVPLRLVGDPARIGQVFINLLGNAVKFTDRGNIVVHVLPIALDEARAGIEIRVEDSGIGVSAEAIERIFTPFHQADASIARRYGGTGLGLAIVSRLVALWGGHVGVASEPGAGSTFWFTLDCALQQADGQQAAPPSALAGRKALVYDDNPAAQRALHNLLLGWSMRVVAARNPSAITALLDAARRDGVPFDLAVLGLRLTRDEHGTYQPDQVVDIVRRHHALPLLLAVNCRYTELLSRSLHDDGIRVVVKPLRSSIVHGDLCALLGLDAPGEAPADGGRRAEFAGLRVLVAEDNDFNLDLLTRVLESGGAVVAQARDGEAAVALARARRFDIVIMDLHLPGMDGAETARRLRALEAGAGEMPIIALTADVFAIEHPPREMDDCLIKPLDERELWRAIGRLRRGRSDHPPRRETAMSVAEITRRMRPRLIGSLALQRRRLAEALERRDAAALRELAHELKGLSGYFGLKELALAVAELERRLAQTGDADACRPQIERIDALIAQLEPATGEAPGT